MLEQVTWAEVIRKLKGRGVRRGPIREGQPPAAEAPRDGQGGVGGVHTNKDAGRLGNRILREAGVE
jgi:hypothetical protein